MIPFERLAVAQRAHAFALEIYRATAQWSDRILVFQLRRAVLSVPSNIAEGAARESRREFARFIGIAFASAAEARYQLRLARDLGFLPPARHASLDDELQQTRKMLWGLLKALRDPKRNRTRP